MLQERPLESLPKPFKVGSHYQLKWQEKNSGHWAEAYSPYSFLPQVGEMDVSIAAGPNLNFFLHQSGKTLSPLGDVVDFNTDSNLLFDKINLGVLVKSIFGLKLNKNTRLTICTDYRTNLVGLNKNLNSFNFTSSIIKKAVFL